MHPCYVFYTLCLQLPVNKLSDQIRLEVALLGFTEALTFALCSCDDISSRLRKKMNETSAVQIANPKTSEFQVIWIA